MGRTLFIGIDIGADTNMIRILDDTGEDICGFTVSYDLAGTERLVEKIVDLADALPADKVKIGMEATNLYWWHLSQALHDDPQLTALGTERTCFFSLEKGNSQDQSQERSSCPFKSRCPICQQGVPESSQEKPFHMQYEP